MGDCLLVAPMFAGESSREVYLPAGKWYDFYTGAFVGENQKISISPALDKIPLFVKDGGIIPMIPTRRQAPKAGEILQLEVRHYGESTGSFQLYGDDGVSFDYEKGVYSFTRLAVSKSSDGNLQGELPTFPVSKPFGYNKMVKWVYMTKGRE